MLQRTGNRRILRPAGLVTTVGSAIALCIMGDSLMYSILPLEAATLGFSMPMVGVLLSANRFIRLFSNRWAGTSFEQHGSRWPFVGSVLLGLLSTSFYGIRAGFLVFLIARITWGIAWSGLRQGGYVSTWSGRPSVRGALTGLLFGIIRLGSAAGVVLGGAIYDRYGFVVTIITVVGIGLLAIPISFVIPWQPNASQNTPDTSPETPTRNSTNGWRQLAEIAFRLPTYRWLSLSGFFVYMLGGIVVSTTSIFIASQITDSPDALALGIGVATLTGLLHGTRWVSNLLIGPFVGALSDRFGKANTLLALGTMMLGALFAVSTLPPQGAVVVFLFILLLDGSLTVVISGTASTVATGTDRPHTFIAAFATVADMGSAFGPIIAFSALANTRLPIVYIAASSILIFCLAKYWVADRSHPAQPHSYDT